MRRPDLKGRRKQARELSEMWNRISGECLFPVQGCSCCAGGLALHGVDFEPDIFELLISDARKAGITDLESLLDIVARRGDGLYSLPKLIEFFAEDDCSMPQIKEVEFALSQVRSILTAIEAAQNKGRFACD